MQCKCGAACTVLMSQQNLRSSEFYCPKCHTSYPMTDDQIQQIMMQQGPPKRGPNDLRSP